jgi:hypothetical protein
MRPKLSFVLAAVVSIMLAAPAFAQSPKTEANLQHILAKHPKLAANPHLVNNPTWQKEHPDVYAWFEHHPEAMRQTSHAGAWETNGTWREPDWWFHNNPNWVSQNRPDWIDREWWRQNHRDWVAQHHPEWAQEHQGPPYGHAYGHYKHKHKDKDHDND